MSTTMELKISEPAEDDLRKTLQKLTRVGRYHAVREGVPRAEVDDCEVTFVERMLLQGLARAHHQGSACREAWLQKCAQNHARNYRRHITRRERRHVSLSA